MFPFVSWVFLIEKTKGPHKLKPLVKKQSDLKLKPLAQKQSDLKLKPLVKKQISELSFIVSFLFFLDHFLW